MHETRVGADRLESLRDDLVVTGDRKRLDVIAPFSGEVLATIPSGTEEDVEDRNREAPPRDCGCL